MKADAYCTLLLAAVLLAFSVHGMKDDPCITDSQCFAQCEKDLGRPCTDEDVFGPACEDCERDEDDCVHNDLPADHPDYCAVPTGR